MLERQILLSLFQVVVSLIREIKVFDKTHIEVVFDFDDCYKECLNVIASQGHSVEVDSTGKLNIRLKLQNDVRRITANKSGLYEDYREQLITAEELCQYQKVEASLETFRKPLKLQANVEEIKFKNLYAKGDFLQCVKERRLFETLSWIDKSPFYIHYTNVNNLFYTLVEIFDSIVKPDEISEFGYDYFKMKSVFYYMFKGKADALQILMFKYKYPNIQWEDVEAFCNDLLFLLGSRREMEEEEKFLAGMLARAVETDELVFLHDNDDYVMQENYAEFYTDPIRKYQKSRHIFDEETTVQDIVKKQIAMGENMADNFKYVKSETDIFVQLLDVVAGILGKLFKYINSTSVNQRRRDVEGLSKLQVENILLIDKLRMEADRENPGFLCSIGPWDGIGILNRFFEMVKSRKEK